MTWDVAGLGNAIMDALVVLDDDALIEELGLTRGTMHPVDHARWQQVYERVRQHKVTFDSGGSCANTVSTVGRLGGRALYRGQVGDDQMGKMYASLMEQSCGQHALCYSSEVYTGKCLSIISRSDAERTMLTDLGASIHLPDLGGFEAALRDTKIAHFTGYTLLGGPVKATVARGLDIARASGAQISIDAADPFVIATLRDEFWQVLRDYANIAFLNEDEARSLSGIADPEAACAHIADEAALGIVCVKLGKRGSLVRVDGVTHHIPVKLVQAIDTTGAGDSYAGGFLYGLARGWEPERCGHLATRVAGLAVAQIGAVVKDHDALQRSIAEAKG